MAFALSIKSKTDFPNAGKVFLVLTLIITSFTLIYSMLLLNFVLHKCNLINTCDADNFENELQNKSIGYFSKFKIYCEYFNDAYLRKVINRDVNQVIVHKEKKKKSDNLNISGSSSEPIIADSDKDIINNIEKVSNFSLECEDMGKTKLYFK